MNEWNAFINHRGGMLVVGHGTRNREGTQQLLNLANEMQRANPELPLVASFLELASPTIDESLEKLASLGVRRILVVPILLFEAGHASHDIPEQVAVSAQRLGLEVIGQTSPLGVHPQALALSQHRMVEALQAVTGGLSGLDLGRLGLAMVGRGASDPKAIADMQRFASLRQQRTQPPIAWCRTGFFVGGSPNVDELLESAAAADCSMLVVQPHLLFEGELVVQLRAKVADWQQRQPSKGWIVPSTLGSDPQLARTFLALAEEFLRENTPCGD